ncbi:MAG: ABC transporter ATP-binding protein [Acidobacteria bacterium]|nr:ABC transporter ATP-binding protein [Acidobacteriota bacterium]
MAGIILQDVDLEFRVDALKHDTFRSALVRFLGRRTSRRIKTLQSISLRIERGERVGLIGHNGAGKTTLLKVMAGIYPPQRGLVATEGHICPLFEVVTGFEWDASGWENIRTRALLLGMSPGEIDRRIEGIGRFSNLGEFLDIPVRHYSQGMHLRLAFATSAAVEPEILLLDEVMAAGDVAFIDTARRRMNELMTRASIVVFATHSLDMLPHFCERTILLRHGRIVADGPTREVVQRYEEAEAEAPGAFAEDARAGRAGGAPSAPASSAK